MSLTEEEGNNVIECAIMYISCPLVKYDAVLRLHLD